MFDIDQAISRWRQEMAAGGIKSSKVLDELESHLRDDVRSLESAGTPEAQAFQIAVSRLGDTASVSTEFKKLSNKASVTLKVGVLLWAGLSTALAASLLMGFFPGQPMTVIPMSAGNLLLLAHAFCLTAGYTAAFLTGGLGIYYICCQWFRKLSLTCQRALSRAVLLFSGLSVGCVLGGLLLGTVWLRQNVGSYFAGGPREVGTLCAIVWLISFWLMQRLGQMSRRATMLLCILGNVVVSLAWFGAGIIAHGNRIGSYWLLDAWLGVHLVFFAMGLLPRLETAEA